MGLQQIIGSSLESCGKDIQITGHALHTPWNYSSCLGHAERVSVKNKVWPTLPTVVIDYAVAEPAAGAGDVAVIPAYCSRDDVGNFARIARLSSAKEVNDVKVIGDGFRVFTQGSAGIVVSDTKRVRARVGIQDVVLVDTPDALLVTTRAHAHSVKRPETD